jgi:hypothetical protein
MTQSTKGTLRTRRLASLSSWMVTSSRKQSARPTATVSWSGPRFTIPPEATNSKRASSSGNVLKAFQGDLTNAILDQHWDLIDAQGSRFSGSSFNAVYRITLPGRAPDVQTQTVHRAYP